MTEPSPSVAHANRTIEDTFVGGGEMGAAMRAHDWEATPLGPVENWPQSLRTAISIVLDSRFPMYIAWGGDYIQFYNDAYRPILGATKHPAALGRSSAFTFAEVWEHYVAPLFAKVMDRAEPTYIDDWMLPMDRFGFVEECYFTFCYSAIRNESGGVGGVLVAVVETTARVLGARRVASLREVAAIDTKLASTAAVCGAAIQALSANRHDIPFALLYLLDEAGKHLDLSASSGVERGSRAAPHRVELREHDDDQWPFHAAIERRSAVIVDDVFRRFGDLPGGPWPEPSTVAVLLPVALTGQEHPYGVLVVGTSHRLELDDGYRGFLELAAGQIGRALAGARAFEAERSRAAALAELDRAKTQFFSNVSHEFRTPLALLIGPLEEILERRGEALAPELSSQLDVAHRNALRLLSLVNALLDFSRIEAGRAEATYEALDVPAFTAELASGFRSAIESAGLELVVDCPPMPGTSAPVFADRTMWEKIVLNLVSNAFKHTFEGSIVVAVRSGDGHVLLEVRDTGIGIPPDQTAHIFERFHRVPQARSRTHEGTGIGLALVQELVRLHGGSITVSSEDGVGTSFQVRIPTGSAHLPADHLAARSASAGPSATVRSFLAEASQLAPGGAALRHDPAPDGSPSKGRVLLADDNADMRNYVSRLLRDAGWEVEAVADGIEALHRARMHPPDVVLSDVMMPGLDGFALLRALRCDPATSAVPVIMLSARAGEEARVDGLDAGADDYLVKPFTARELTARVAAHVSLAQERQRVRSEMSAAGSRLSSVFAQAPVAIAVLHGPEHLFVLANEPYRALVGDRELIGLSVRQALPELEGQGIYELLDAVFRTQQPYVGNEIRLMMNAPGTDVPDERYFNFVYQPMLDANASSEGIAVVATDVTDLVRSRQTAERAQNDAEQANRAKSDFLAAMSHELRTPLNAIAGYVQILELGIHGEVTEAQRETLARIQRSGQHLLALITDVLNFAKLEAGRVDYAIRDVDVADVVANTVHIIDPQLSAKQLVLDVSVPGGVIVRADDDKLRQIILNLLSNAVKFTPRGGRITIDTTRRDSGEDGGQPGFVFLRVSDTGIGIPREKLDTVFDPFVQVHRDLTRSTEGTGLGLAISRDLARAMGGDLRARSVEGKGSVFTLALART